MSLHLGFLLLIFTSSLAGGEEDKDANLFGDVDLSSPHALLAHLAYLGASLRPSVSSPVYSQEGGQAELACRVAGQGNATLMWNKMPGAAHKTALALTANTERIAGDRRFSVVHDIGGQVYILHIADVQQKDGGLYSCEVDGVSSFHRLVVRTRPSAEAKEGDFTACCAARNVSLACRGLCSIGHILNGTTGVAPELCDAEMGAIVACMADRKDHRPCCREARIPPFCRDMCSGQYNQVTGRALGSARDGGFNCSQSRSAVSRST